MEHIIQFGVSLDDAAIEKRATELAAKSVADRMKEIMFGHYGNGLSGNAEEVIYGFMEKHKEEIIERAAYQIAEYLKRTKVVKDATKEVIG